MSVVGQSVNRTSAVKGESGFTLIDLLFTASLICTIASMALPSLMRARGVALETLAQRRFCAGFGRSEARRQPIELGRVLQRRLHRIVQRVDDPRQVERVRRGAIDANALALVVELGVVARRAREAHVIAGMFVLHHRLRHRCLR